ncbi:MAG: hydantoinase/oxoprolinase family protein [Gammaproteobacteria bacterium]|nr:hydantoinase/oxoprolinase family protein [Gammaproteobacteria bacterium]
MNRLGVDTGGTFTDFVWIGARGELRVHKVLSTPDAPERAILQGVRELGLDLEGLQLVHGSTVATNAVLEGKGVRTAYVTNTGFADLLTIGRQQREQLYELQPPRPSPPVPAELCVEVPCRIDSEGREVDALTGDALAALRDTLLRLEPEAVAVNLLFSYLDPVVEARIADVVPDGVFLSLSSHVLPEIREYERGMATWLNAWIGPRVAGYLRRLGHALGAVPVSVMQSSGDTVAATQAAEHAVRMLLSGPAGGLVAAREIGRLCGEDRLLTFDMGGTSTDVALVEASPRLTTEGRIGRYPVAVPMVDMHTIGAGGGSIAWLDSGGMLQVGPQSAGADPGPACYARGGTSPVVTDANLVLGRLQPDAFLGGSMALDKAAAERALAALAGAMGRDMLQAARDIIAVANEHMAQALRAISVKRGVDPRDHRLVSFGGAGGLHVCALADRLDIARAIVPVHGGVLSALGMLAARPGRQLSRSLVMLLQGAVDGDIDDELDRLRQQGVGELVAEGFDATEVAASPGADLRYAGQSYTLNLPWQGVGPTAGAFHAAHEARYGHRLDLPVELVNLRQSVQVPGRGVSLPDWQAGEPGTPHARCVAVGIDDDVPRYRRSDLVQGQRVAGPALIEETVATTWLAPGWHLDVDRVGNLLLARVD